MFSLGEKNFVLLRIWGWMWAKVFLLFEVVLDYNSKRIVEIILRGRISIFGGPKLILYILGKFEKFWGSPKEPSGSAPVHQSQLILKHVVSLHVWMNISLDFLILGALSSLYLMVFKP